MARKTSTFDFEAGGYQSPGDWARLWDLVPELPAITSDHDLKRLEHLKANDTKDNVCAYLDSLDVEYDRRYDAEAAATRNA